jgi:hypothetical protein
MVTFQRAIQEMENTRATVESNGKKQLPTTANNQ